MMLIMAACGHSRKTEPAYTDAQCLQLDTTVHTKNIDSLLRCVNRWHKAGNRGREMGALAELGHGYQTASQYSDAVKVHQKQLAIAQSMNDTLMEASALNDLGINYRRLGLYYDGLDYHLRAVEKTLTPQGNNNRKLLKCRAIGYNGAGNVYLSIGSFQKADQMLRKALAVEMRLNSHLGMNVDLSNIGLVFERRGMTDSAWVYFRKAMRQSKLAGSTTGQAYGHLNYGRLYTRQNDYDKAVREYRHSMDIVYKDRDLWLWLQPCIGLAGAYIQVGSLDSARHYLDLALQTAQSIGAREYIPQIYHLYADYHEQQGDPRKALEAYRTADERQDSLLGARNLFEIETLQNNLYDRRQQQPGTGTATRAMGQAPRRDGRIAAGRAAGRHVLCAQDPRPQPPAAEADKCYARALHHQHHARIPNATHHHTRTEPRPQAGQERHATGGREGRRDRTAGQQSAATHQSATRHIENQVGRRPPRLV